MEGRRSVQRFAPPQVIPRPSRASQVRVRRVESAGVTGSVRGNGLSLRGWAVQGPLPARPTASAPRRLVRRSGRSLSWTDQLTTEARSAS